LRFYKYNIRNFIWDTDFNFICSSWLKSYERSYFAEHIINGVFHIEHRNLIESKLMNPAFCTVAVNAHDSDQIYGYAVAENDCLHYVYVKKMFRGLGIGMGLVDSMDMPEKFYYSHFSTKMDRVVERKNGVYNPYLFLRQYED